MIYWDIYQIESVKEKLLGIKLRGRIRKFAIGNNIECLTENASDVENSVRFGITSGSDCEEVVNFIQEIVGQVKIIKVIEKIENPVLSKLKVNDISRY